MTQESEFHRIEELIRKQLVETGTPSLAVAVARGGEIIWEEGFGWADRENLIPATAHTLYSLASISKPMTATGVMVLKERGCLDLDRPINDYLGETKLRAWVGQAANATIRRVANHSSGLPLHYHFFHEDEGRRPPPMDETIRRYGNLVWAPGERCQYSNLGYGVLNYVIARLSGKSYPDFMREEVFLPLGMTRASVGIGPGLEKHQAVRYGRDALPIPFYDFDHPGASAVFCSAHDLARFGMFHLQAHLPEQKAIISDPAIDAMQKPTMACDDGRSGYGIAWKVVEDDAGYRSVGHTGGMGGVNTMLTMIPSERLAVVALANASSPLPGRVALEILSVLLPRYAEKHARIQARQKKEAETKAPAAAFKPPPGLLGKWTGNAHTSKGDVPFSLWFQEDGDVHAQVGSQLKTLLNDARLKNGWLSGQLMGDLATRTPTACPTASISR